MLNSAQFDSQHTALDCSDNTQTEVLTVSNVENDAAAVRYEQTERLGGMTLQTQAHKQRKHTHTARDEMPRHKYSRRAVRIMRAAGEMRIM